MFTFTMLIKAYLALTIVVFGLNFWFVTHALDIALEGKIDSYPRYVLLGVLLGESIIPLYNIYALFTNIRMYCDCRNGDFEVEIVQIPFPNDEDET